jgi:carboxyl-terminal processing protease
VSDDMVLEFQDYLNIRIGSKITFVAYHEEVKQYIKATLANQLFGNGAFQEVLNQRDIMLDEVMAMHAVK